MKAFAILVLAMLLVCPQVLADPVTGTYHSTDLGGQLYTGRASTWRTGINSGLPHVLHIQSWDGNTLGTQWEILCPIEDTPFDVQDNRVNGTGTIVYTSVFHGGTFIFYPGGWRFRHRERSRSRRDNEPRSIDNYSAGLPGIHGRHLQPRSRGQAIRNLGRCMQHNTAN